MHSIKFKLEHVNHVQHESWIKYITANNRNPEHKGTDNVIKWGNKIHWIKIMLVVCANVWHMYLHSGTIHILPNGQLIWK
jgi:hypothetical protein